MSTPVIPLSPFLPTIVKGKVALITGGGSGIGYEIARQFGLHGAKIAIMGRRESILKTAVTALKEEGIDAMYVQGDVRKVDGTTSLCASYVNNAVFYRKLIRTRVFICRMGRWQSGHIRNCRQIWSFRYSGELCGRKVRNQYGYKRGYIAYDYLCILSISYHFLSSRFSFLVTAEDLSTKGFQTVMEIDTIGTFNMCHAAFPQLKATKNALIINISATLHKPATWYQVHASAAKAAIDSLTRSLALEWSEYGVRVNGVAPGPIADTAGMTKLSGGISNDMMNEQIPLRRMGTKWDVAMSCLYLASTAGSYVSGETIVVDGKQNRKQTWLKRNSIHSIINPFLCMLYLFV